MNLKKWERYLRVNLFGPGPRLIKKIIFRAAVLQGLRNSAISDQRQIFFAPEMYNVTLPISESVYKKT